MQLNCGLELCPNGPFAISAAVASRQNARVGRGARALVTSAWLRRRSLVWWAENVEVDAADGLGDAERPGWAGETVGRGDEAANPPLDDPLQAAAASRPQLATSTDRSAQDRVTASGRQDDAATGSSLGSPLG